MTRLLVLLIASVVAVPARAEAPQPVRVTTFLLAHPGVSDQAVVPVMRALDEGLKRNPRLEMKDLDTRLADFAQEVPQEQIDEARQAFKEGQQALTNLELPQAVQRLGQAVKLIAKVLPYMKKQELADAMMALAAAQYEQDDKKAAKATMVRLLTWRQDYRLDTTKYPPSLIQPLEDARREVEKTRRGSIEIRSEPPAAQAYVDGRYVGVTPTFAEGLPAGEHWVTLKKEGFRKAVMPATVSSKVQQVVTMPLERSGKYLLVEQALASIEKTVGAPTLDKSAGDLREVLFIDHAVFVRPRAAQSGALQIDAYLYDLRTGRRLTRVERTVPIAQAQKRLESLASSLYLKVSYEAELEAPKDAPPPQPVARRPFYKTWWFWTVTGAVVAGAAVGTYFGVTNAPKDCGSAFCPGFTF